MPPGPPPKREAERRRRNKPLVETTKVDLSTIFEAEVEIPAADPDWHAVARMWYQSLAKSGQALFYEPSDWATAYVLAESMSRDLEEQVVGITDDGEVVRAEIPMKGASLTAYLKGFTALMVTEGDRRRAQMEIARAQAKAAATTAGAGAKVASISQKRMDRFKREQQG